MMLSLINNHRVPQLSDSIYNLNQYEYGAPILPVNFEHNSSNKRIIEEFREQLTYFEKNE